MSPLWEGKNEGKQQSIQLHGKRMQMHILERHAHPRGRTGTEREDHEDHSRKKAGNRVDGHHSAPGGQDALLSKGKREGHGEPDCYIRAEMKKGMKSRWLSN